MTEELKDQRIPIMMSPSEVAAVDDWMFARRMKSRAAAIRELIRYGTEYDYWRAETYAARALIGALVRGEDPKEHFKAWVDAANELGDLYEKKKQRQVADIESMIEVRRTRLDTEELSESDRALLLDEIEKLIASIQPELSSREQG